MPELPEVEVTRLGLSDELRGAQVLEARVGKALRWPLGCDPGQLCGRHVGELFRRGKYLWMPLSPAGLAASTPTDDMTAPPALPGLQAPAPAAPPADSGGLLIHLGMSGSLGLNVHAGPPGPHDHFELRTSRGTLRLTDPRRFGAVVWSTSLHDDPAKRLLARLGAEPFDPFLTPARFHSALRQRRTPIKAALLAGDIVVGAGNIYACEALFRAAIHPRLRCERLSLPRSTALLQALRQTLSEAIALGGSTLRNFRDAHGMSGEFTHQALVYGREGQPCKRCGAAVKRIVQGQRATYFCAHCQKR